MCFPRGTAWPRQLDAVVPGRRPRPAVHVPMTHRSQVEPVNRIRADDVERLPRANQRRRHRRQPVGCERPRHTRRPRHRARRQRTGVQRDARFERRGRERRTCSAAGRTREYRGHDRVGIRRRPVLDWCGLPRPAHYRHAPARGTCQLANSPCAPLNRNALDTLTGGSFAVSRKHGSRLRAASDRSTPHTAPELRF